MMKAGNATRLWILGAIPILAVLVGVGVHRMDDGQPSPTEQAQATAVTPPTEEPKIDLPRPGVEKAAPRVRAIHSEWGFVTLDHIQDLDLDEGSRLDVIRGGNVVAKLCVTSVGGEIASADVLPGPDGQGIPVRAGDLIR